MGLTSPLPSSLPSECKKAAKIFSGFSSDQDVVIPREILQQARGFAIFTILKVGFLASGRAGSGIVIARQPNGTWSAPSAIGLAGAGFGGQAGIELTEFIVVLNSKAAVKTFMSAGSLTLGGNMSIAVGPLGRNAEGSGSVNTKGKVAAMYSYSKTKGLFGGVSVEGAVIVERSDANSKAYGFDVKARQLLSGQVEPPEWADNLLRAIGNRAGTSLDDNWVDDSPLSSPAITTRNRGYSFDSPSSSIEGASTPPKTKSKSGLSKFAPSLSRSSSSGKFDNSFARLDLQDSRTSDEEDSPYGVWAADARRSSSPWRDEASDSKKKKSRSRSGTLLASAQPRQRTSDNPFADSKEDLVDSDDMEVPYSPNRNNRDSVVSNDTITSADYDHPSSKFNFNGERMAQQKADFGSGGGSSSGARSYDRPRPTRTPSNPPLPARPKAALPTAVALYDFESSESGDLPFRKHDVIEIVKQVPGEQWWVGRHAGREGIFPINYVDLL